MIEFSTLIPKHVAFYQIIVMKIKKQKAQGSVS